jgi:hypothetical protein
LVSELNSNGSALAFSTYWDGGAAGYGDSLGNAIAVGGAGNIYASGVTSAPDFPVVNPIQSQLLSPANAFIARFAVLPDFTVAGSPESLTVSAGQTSTRWYHSHAFAGKNLNRSLYSGQVGLVYIEPKNDPGRYDREVFLAMHQWEPYYSASMEESDEGTRLSGRTTRQRNIFLCSGPASSIHW